jgi:hypothetical protein
MPLPFYHIIHLIGFMLLFAGIGALAAGPSAKKLSSILHGTGLLFILVSGFGLLAKMGITTSYPQWVIYKWVLFAALVVLPILGKRKILPMPAVLVLAFVCGGTLAWLGYLKPVW